MVIDDHLGLLRCIIDAFSRLVGRSGGLHSYGLLTLLYMLWFLRNLQPSDGGGIIMCSKASWSTRGGFHHANICSEVDRVGK